MNQWTFDAGGNPVREDVYAGSSFITDFQSMIASGTATDKQVKSFLSKNTPTELRENRFFTGNFPHTRSFPVQLRQNRFRFRPPRESR